ncbi:MAG: penicillin acylase family protein [Gemmatimonadota bacterium]
MWSLAAYSAALPVVPRARSATLVAFAIVGLHVSPAAGQESTTLTLPGLEQPVEILVDQWGISHIYAETEHDLFFAQGWNAARDRLFQLELWRRQATGTVAEILGERELERDIGTRLFKFRRDLEQELNYYHDRGSLIIRAYTDGINAYIAQTEADPDLLTPEFGLLGITPGYWTPDVVISRHQGLLGNIGQELTVGRRVAELGAEMVKDLSTFGPGDPLLELDPAIDGEALSEDILGIYNAFRGRVQFRPEDIVDPSRRADDDSFAMLERAAADASAVVAYDVEQDIGSNNWIVDGSRSESGYPMMANDPHRAQGAPSLRYWVHLVGPGWNVIGGGEPSLPGVSIGHNEYGAWGLTVFSTDGEDLYVYETNPSDPNQYRYRGQWESMTTITEQIPVKGRSAHTAELKYTRHGPVVFEDRDRNLAYAVRAAWMEVGGAPYLSSLRMDQAKTWEEFRQANAYSHIPGENMVWAGRDGTIGWQSVGIAPIRRHWSGLVPVPGDGRYEWDGYLPITAKPHVVNPPEGYFATANNDLVPRDYEYMDAIGFSWSDPYRWLRIVEVLGSGTRFSMADMMRLQTDELSLPARQLVPMLDAGALTGRAEEARQMLLEWDYVLDMNSVEAGIYAAFEAELRRRVRDAIVPASTSMNLSLRKVIETIMIPPGSLGPDPLSARNDVLAASLVSAVENLERKLGTDMSRWQYGQAAYHHARLRHPLGNAVDASTREMFEEGPAPRGGYGSTVNQTGNGDNQTAGASFRIIVDTSDWDRSVGMNTPGQSGDVRSRFYDNLFDYWASDDFHPVLYTRSKIEDATAVRIDLRPGS